MKHLLLSISVLWLGLHWTVGHSLSKLEIKAPEELVYKVKEGDDGKSLTITSPNLEEPSLTEIIYYHIIEKPFGKSKVSDNQASPAVVTPDSNESDDRTFTNGPGFQFLPPGDDNPNLPLDEDDDTKLDSKNPGDKDSGIDDADSKKDITETPNKEAADKDAENVPKRRRKRDLSGKDMAIEDLKRAKKRSHYRRHLPKAPRLSKLDPGKLPKYIQNLLSSSEEDKDTSDNDVKTATVNSLKDNDKAIKKDSEALNKNKDRKVPGDGFKTYGMELKGNGGKVWNNLNGRPIAYHVGSDQDSNESNSDSDSSLSDDSSGSSDSGSNSDSSDSDSDSNESPESGENSHSESEDSGDEKKNISPENDSSSGEGSDSDSGSNEGNSSSGENSGSGDSDSGSNESESGESGSGSSEEDKKIKEPNKKVDILENFNKILTDLHDIFVKGNASIVLPSKIQDTDKSIDVPNVLNHVLDEIQNKSDTLTPGTIVKENDSKSPINVLEGLFTNIIKNNIVINNEPDKKENIESEKDINSSNKTEIGISSATKLDLNNTEDTKNLHVTVAPTTQIPNKDHKQKQKPIEKSKAPIKSKEEKHFKKPENPQKISEEKDVNGAENTTKRPRGDTINKLPVEPHTETSTVSPIKSKEEKHFKEPENPQKISEEKDVNGAQKTTERPRGDIINKLPVEPHTEAPQDVSKSSNEEQPTEICPVQNKKEKTKPEKNSKLDDMMDLINNEKFWTFMGDLGAKYLNSLTERTTKFIKQEIAAQVNKYFEEHKTVIHKEPIREINAEKAAHEAEHPKEPINKEKVVNIEPKRNKYTENKPKKDSVHVKANTVYGNTVGNDKVTNIYIFYASKNIEDIMKNIKSLVNGNNSTNIFTFGPLHPEHINLHKDKDTSGKKTTELPKVTDVTESSIVSKITKATESSTTVPNTTTEASKIITNPSIEHGKETKGPSTESSLNKEKTAPVIEKPNHVTPNVGFKHTPEHTHKTEEHPEANKHRGKVTRTPEVKINSEKDKTGNGHFTKTTGKVHPVTEPSLSKITKNYEEIIPPKTVTEPNVTKASKESHNITETTTESIKKKEVPVTKPTVTKETQKVTEAMTEAEKKVPVTEPSVVKVTHQHHKVTEREGMTPTEAVTETGKKNKEMGVTEPSVNKLPKESHKITTNKGIIPTHTSTEAGKKNKDVPVTEPTVAKATHHHKVTEKEGKAPTKTSLEAEKSKATVTEPTVTKITKGPHKIIKESIPTETTTEAGKKLPVTKPSVTKVTENPHKSAEKEGITPTERVTESIPTVTKGNEEKYNNKPVTEHVTKEITPSGVVSESNILKSTEKPEKKPVTKPTVAAVTKIPKKVTESKGINPAISVTEPSIPKPTEKPVNKTKEVPVTEPSIPKGVTEKTDSNVKIASEKDKVSTENPKKAVKEVGEHGKHIKEAPITNPNVTIAENTKETTAPIHITEASIHTTTEKAVNHSTKVPIIKTNITESHKGTIKHNITEKTTNRTQATSAHKPNITTVIENHKRNKLNLTEKAGNKTEQIPAIKLNNTKTIKPDDIKKEKVTKGTNESIKAEHNKKVSETTGKSTVTHSPIVSKKVDNDTKVSVTEPSVAKAVKDTKTIAPSTKVPIESKKDKTITKINEEHPTTESIAKGTGNVKIANITISPSGVNNKTENLKGKHNATKIAVTEPTAKIPVISSKVTESPNKVTGKVEGVTEKGKPLRTITEKPLTKSINNTSTEHKIDETKKSKNATENPHKIDITHEKLKVSTEKPGASSESKPKTSEKDISGKKNTTEPSTDKKEVKEDSSTAKKDINSKKEDIKKESSANKEEAASKKIEIPANKSDDSSKSNKKESSIEKNKILGEEKGIKSSGIKADAAIKDATSKKVAAEKTVPEEKNVNSEVKKDAVPITGKKA